ncbi:MAG: F0F1 ATP synthase subunit beta, partial [Actinomycetota bacterium]|nr:F0F1 ATP synthase subunit beta [Actinomycetota bacterium]
MTATTETTTAVGRVVRVTGPVVDVEFPPDGMPAIFNALTVDVVFSESQGEGEANRRMLTLEVEQHLGDNMVRAISLQPTDGLVRGAAVTDTGAAISVPVGDVTKGHVWNALGV